MNYRFTDIDNDTAKIIKNLIQKDFKHLIQAKIKIIFDTKKRKSAGRYVLGKLQKTNELLQYLTAPVSDDALGYDYMLFLDEKVFTVIDELDKIRLIRHILQYADIDYEAENPFKIRKEEVLTWYDEIEFNKEDPRWFDRLQVVAESIYNSDEEESNELVVQSE